MKGGFNNPPNPASIIGAQRLRPASMKGGFNNPPNALQTGISPESAFASMKGGFNNPPNSSVAVLDRLGVPMLQ